MKKLFFLIAFLTGMMSNISNAQSINAYQYTRADQANSKLFIDNIKHNLEYLQNAKVDWNNASTIESLNNSANQEFAKSNGLEYVQVDNVWAGGLDNVLNSNTIKTSPYYEILVQVNQVINNSTSYSSFSDGGLIKIRQSPTYLNLTEKQKADVDTYLCTLDNFMSYANTLVASTPTDHIPQRGPMFYPQNSPTKWPSWLKCAAGIVGGVLGGGLGGAAAGSVVPGIGTVAGGIIGAIGGGLTGASQAC